MTGRAADSGKSASNNKGLIREARRAAELRANLARRKAQARARAELQGAAQAGPEAERPNED
jgi:hypothetical protein